jgi:hypothetical protein
MTTPKLLGLAFIIAVTAGTALVFNQPKVPEECIWLHPSPTSTECVTISTLKKRNEDIAQELFRRYPEAMWQLSHGG